MRLGASIRDTRTHSDAEPWRNELAADLLQWGRAPEGAEISTFGFLIVSFPDTLQWGRAPEGAEMRITTIRDDYNAKRLQWGRAPEGAEMLSPWWNRKMRPCFNGAAPRRVRRFRRAHSDHYHAASASMGPRPGGCGDA